ncbi:hypothetical protein LQ948_07215 [Jiella sp. MQZ9-1]|uniref:Uncharacterized protein n=1 Tax=Jiella flava TaxID=2816857 RepID=A0A939FWS2_9HYPH|nr:hypothetical protein [Jiella flava]MBO0662176.1 hypothetical protein [Jiella flava]MCD2470994.1 hypothetical protein [Jiella flava]
MGEVAFQVAAADKPQAVFPFPHREVRATRASKGEGMAAPRQSSSLPLRRRDQMGAARELRQSRIGHRNQRRFLATTPPLDQLFALQIDRLIRGRSSSMDFAPMRDADDTSAVDQIKDRAPVAVTKLKTLPTAQFYDVTVSRPGVTHALLDDLCLIRLRHRFQTMTGCGRKSDFHTLFRLRSQKKYAGTDDTTTEVAA